MNDVRLILKKDDKLVEVIEDEKTIDIPSVQKRVGLIIDDKGDILVERRGYGEFEGKALRLNESYDWIMGHDHEGYLIFVPMRKGVK